VGTLGAVLMQVQDGNERPITFFSKKKLKSAQRNHSTTDRECLGVVPAIEKFRPYIEDSKCDDITSKNTWT
jgi:RNase H-like domain found in reverse transcriptase